MTYRRFAGVHLTFEPADRGVGIMAESFAAWPVYSDGKNDGPWCELLDCATGAVRWEDSETGKDCERPAFGDLVEAMLRSFVEAYYAREVDESIAVALATDPSAPKKEKTLRCDMRKDCGFPVTHLDEKGFVYCAKHGEERKARMRCRKLKPAELAKLNRGETLAKY